MAVRAKDTFSDTAGTPIQGLAIEEPTGLGITWRHINYAADTWSVSAGGRAVSVAGSSWVGGIRPSGMYLGGSWTCRVNARIEADGDEIVLYLPGTTDGVGGSNMPGWRLSYGSGTLYYNETAFGLSAGDVSSAYAPANPAIAPMSVGDSVDVTVVFDADSMQVALFLGEIEVHAFNVTSAWQTKAEGDHYGLAVGLKETSSSPAGVSYDDYLMEDGATPPGVSGGSTTGGWTVAGCIFI